LNYLGDKNYQHGSVAATGVLFVNLGTPTAPTAKAVRRYLAEFLWDRRVVEIPRPLWWLILHLFVLPLRPRKSAAAYAKIWSDEGSPLLVHSARLARAVDQSLQNKLQHELQSALQNELQNGEHPKLVVRLAMRYGQPSIEEALNEMREKLVQRLLLLPLFPQYSATTTASVFDKVAQLLSTWRWQPELRTINHYHKHPLYIAACAAQIRDFRSHHGAGDKLLFSFHGLPKRNLLHGDPYHCQCYTTMRLIAKALSLGEDEYQLSFQSRFGRAEWLQPYTEQTLHSLAAAGVRTVDVFCPGFSADCLETLEEIALQGAAAFKQAGGSQLRYIPAANDAPLHVDCMVDLVVKHIAAWGAEDLEDAESRQQAKQSALALGASR